MLSKMQSQKDEETHSQKDNDIIYFTSRNMMLQAILDDGDGDVSDCCLKKEGFHLGKQQGVDPSQIKKTLPDIKNEIYSTDEFGMFSFKVIPCLKTYSHE